MAQTKTSGQKLEGVAFTFCKVATIALIAGRFTLPVAAGLSGILYILAYAKGQRNTRCVLYYPLVIAALWLSVAAVSLWVILMPDSLHSVIAGFWP